MVCVFPICTNSTLLGTWKLYEAAGRKRWEAGILFTTLLSDENHWPSHLVDLVTFIPIINLIMFPVI
jgi:signal peptidase I